NGSEGKEESGGIPENIKGEITSSRPVVLNEAVRMAYTLMEQKLQAKAERIALSGVVTSMARSPLKDILY
ncbi:hypothetical protein Tco_1512304, partial [Tanacetum coccineum]